MSKNNILKKVIMTQINLGTQTIYSYLKNKLLDLI